MFTPQIKLMSLHNMFPVLMSSSGVDDEFDLRQRINGELYEAIMGGKEKKVIEICRRLQDHALHILTVSEDTILHMATYAKEAELVLKLLNDLPDYHLHKMTRQNRLGNTILHEAATTTKGSILIAEEVLKKAPGLLGMRNHNGETALFRSARYGKIEVFDFLAAKISGLDQPSQLFYLQRNDKTTVLHIAILSQHYDLGCQIANEYKYLIGAKDLDGMTALQLLSCDPSAFKQEPQEGFARLWCSHTRREKVQKEREKYKSAVELARFLVERDTSWKVSHAPVDQSKTKIHKYGAKTSGDILSIYDKLEEDRLTPLMLATKSGCVEIVKEILHLYPQAVEYVDHVGRNILHVAIKYRQLEIFEHVIRMEVPKKRLVRKLDNNGNSILHSVATKRKDFVAEKVEGPAILLQQEMLWFERVEQVTPPHFKHHQNNDKQTADEFFLAANSDLRISAKEWLKSTSEGCTVVAVLIATVAFTAAYTVPGGPNQSTGVPVLVNQPFFVAFTITDVLSLTFALTAVVTFLSILSSPFRFKDFKHSLPDKLMLGFTFLFLSVVMMMIAFGATIILMIKSKESWTKIALSICSFIPVGIFAFAYFPLYSSLSATYKFLDKKARQAVPFTAYVLTIPHRICNFFRLCQVQDTTNSSIP